MPENPHRMLSSFTNDSFGVPGMEISVLPNRFDIIRVEKSAIPSNAYAPTSLISDCLSFPVASGLQPCAYLVTVSRGNGVFKDRCCASMNPSGVSSVLTMCSMGFQPPGDADTKRVRLWYFSQMYSAKW